MATKLFVGGLAWATTDESLRAFFSQAGTVVSAVVITDKFNNNRSKGFGFVEMSTEEEAQKAVALSGQTLDDRAINVSPAKPREDKPRGDFGGNGGYNNNRY